MSINEALKSIGGFEVGAKYLLLAAAAGIVAFYGLKFILNLAVLPSQQMCPRNNPFVGNSDDCFGEVIGTPTGAKINVVTLDLTKIAKDENINKTLIVFNPNGGVRSQMTGVIAGYFNGNYGKVVFWDYPNTGGSKAGKWFVDKESMILAGEAVAKHVASNDFSNITFYGWSLGGGIAAETAIRLQMQGKFVEGIICDRTFSSLTNFIHLNAKVPKILGGIVSQIFNMNIDTEAAFNEFVGRKRSIFSYQDRMINNALLKGEGDNYAEVELGHMSILPQSRRDELLTFSR